MERFVELSREEIVLGFVASCVEFVAEALQRPYDEVYRRMKKCDLLRGYLYKHYEAVHSQSREHVTEDLIGYLRREGCI